MKQQKFRVETRAIPSSLLRGFLTRFENESYGWTFTGNTYEEHSISYDTTISEDSRGRIRASTKRNSKFTKYQYFYRVSPYTDCVPFMIVEGIGRFLSFFRRHSLFTAIINILFWVIMISSPMKIGAEMLMFLDIFDDQLMGLIFVTLFPVVFAWIGSFACAVIGRFMKKEFELDEKLEKAMDEAGVYLNN